MKQRFWVFILSFLITFVVTRLSLYISPDADFNVGSYNIHHLYTGLLILTLAAMPLLIAQPKGKWGLLFIAGFGVGLSLALDEWVYLIATPGSNNDYWLPVSYWGALIVIALTCVYAAIVYWISRR